MVALKVLLVAATVLIATLAARRFGHAVSGLLGGLPLIAGPILGFVLWQEPPASSRAIVLATLVCLPATIVHQLVFAWSALRWRWPGALLAANGAFLAVGALLLALRLPPSAVLGLALLAPALGLRAMPWRAPVPGRVPIPQLELLLRLVAAVVFATLILESAGAVPAALSGLLLATPITANVLPCFTRQVHGPAATVALLAGFVRGLHGFAVFFATLYLALGVFGAGAAYALAWLGAIATAAAMVAWRERNGRRLDPRRAH